jgi:hypothetical protein
VHIRIAPQPFSSAHTNKFDCSSREHRFITRKAQQEPIRYTLTQTLERPTTTP